MADNHFGDWSIDQECFAWILANLPCGSTILELGSGWASGELSRYYKVYSIENNKDFLGKYNSNYIFAPHNGWYDREVIAKNMPKYDLLLIDGPHANYRGEIIKNSNLFDWSKKIVFDDVHEPGLMDIANILVRDIIKRPSQVINGSTNKKFMVIP